METSITLFLGKENDMKLRYRIFVSNLDTLSYSGDALSIEFKNIDNWEFNAVQETDSFSIDISSTTIAVDFYYQSGGGQSYTQDFTSLSTNDDFIEFDGELYIGLDDLQKFIELGIIEIDTTDTLIYCFKQNSENDELNKTLTTGEIIAGKFNHSIAIKNINIDIKNYSIANGYNYVFIPSLNRYYYVDSVEIISADYVRLHLREDVLMSWQDLIKSQKAFVTRYEQSAGILQLFDERRPMADKIELIDFTSSLIDTPLANSLVNCTLDFSNDGANPYPNIMVVTYSTDTPERIYANTKISAPSGSGLPDISSQLNNYEWVSFITPFELDELSHAYYSNDAVSSYIESVIWLPFNPITPFSLQKLNSSAIFVRDKYIDNTGNYINSGGTGTPLPCYHTIASTNKSGICPYLIIKDFTCPNISLLSEREPHTNYEFYIAFVGWVKVDSSKISGSRILIYYTMDLKSGISTAYIYNFTEQYVIWSGTCQLGVKIDMTTSNLIENTKQKQANDLNMILGMLSSAVSFGVGVASENPVAIMGGVLSAGKTIAGYVNANNQIFERSQMSFGTANGSLYSNLEFKCIKATHELLNIDVDIYKHMQGLPYNNYISLSNLSGYVEIGEIHFNPMKENIYQDEIQEIVSLLKDGVIF